MQQLEFITTLANVQRTILTDHAESYDPASCTYGSTIAEIKSRVLSKIEVSETVKFAIDLLII